MGGQWRSQPLADGWQHAGEIALQAGRSRLTALPSDTRDLNHRALFAHAEVSRQWNSRGKPRLTALIDYASGDRSLGDDRNERFDTLYGARRFDFGPTGIYGIQARANTISPGLRWQMRPSRDTGLMVGFRQFWLAEPLDVHAGTDFRQPPEAASRNVGQQLEARLRQSAGEHVELEVGAAWLDKGPVLTSDLHRTRDADTTYVYLQTTVTF